ncbi:hypothetical protein [Neisseria animaloris]
MRKTNKALSAALTKGRLKANYVSFAKHFRRPLIFPYTRHLLSRTAFG